MRKSLKKKKKEKKRKNFIYTALVKNSKRLKDVYCLLDSYIE